MFRKTLGKLIRWAAAGTSDSTIGRAQSPTPATIADELLRGATAGVFVYPISNGYIMRKENYNPSYEARSSILTYAKDESGIADEIIAQNARDRIGVGSDAEAKQREMFTTAQMGSQTTAKRNV